MYRKSINPKEIKKENLGTILQEAIHYFRFLSRSGCRGFDCSPKAVNTLRNWGHMGTSLPDTFEAIRIDLDDCRRCRLSDGRKNIVFGEGDPHARLVFVGEAPGFEEDQTGHPFVGAAGRLLTRIIQAIQLTRQQVYICNIIKCRPSENRNPMPDEIATCLPFLKRQIAIIKPDFICALGTFAAQTLLETNKPITKLRGCFHSYQGIKVLPTYHPAYLLRHEEKKREVWEDMQKLMQEMHG